MQSERRGTLIPFRIMDGVISSAHLCHSSYVALATQGYHVRGSVRSTKDDSKTQTLRALADALPGWCWADALSFLRLR